MADLVTLPPQTLGGVIDTVPFAKRFQLIPDVFGRMDSLLGQAGIFFAGPQTALYRVEDDDMDIRIGVQLPRSLPGFQIFEVPEMQALHIRHHGAFDTLPRIYQALTVEVEKRGLTRTGWAREVYRFVAKDASLNICDVYMDVAQT
ncbi:GyrI-like domain-containing protein [uncultured Tateyamaria sp.]|uniref:GyrI-like domain-containing protein n=1 Tax=uncultured Tateyamaria sp. TaxID=455651 RepID=UPI00262832AD|nr:GyrI-like domain-containing protein [uncultured Tateyamaria sp.]